MKLKKLEITGFKSFYEKVSIKFPSGICAVVGPNGCGKSNIVDALRWVMGEQSVKQLRGKSMEDVIFAGTKGKSALDVAEVSLTLINDNGTLPEEFKDFIDITLTRKLCRSGSSSYRINKQPCRLKDIHNIFLGSGMGAKSYSVIQQGNIGAITEAGPEERRFLVEEAAGVTRYKNRKNEALRKIETTNQNLLRILDIIAEVKRQMSGLKRQAQKAERYKNYKENIKRLDVLIAVFNYDDYTREIEETAFLLTELSDKAFSHTSKLAKLDAAVEKIKFQSEQKKQEISTQKTRKFEAQRRIDKIENDMFYLRQDVKRFADEIIEFESSRIENEEKNKNMAFEIVRIENENATLKNEIKNVRSILDSEQSASQTVKEHLSKLNQAAESYKKTLMSLVVKEAKHKNISQNATNNKDSVKKRLKRINEQKTTAEKKASQSQNDVVKNQAQLDLCQKQIKELNERVAIMRGEITEKNQTLAKQVKITQTLDLDKNKAKSQYVALKKMEDNFEWHQDGVKVVMKKYADKKDAIIGLVANIIETEPSFEIAVEAALGESLQYVLVKNQKAGAALMRYLQTSQTGRVGFIPMSSIKSVKSEFQSKQKLLNHVAVKSGFEQIVDALLGNVLITSSLDEAINLHNNGASQTIVTTDGYVISCDGIMTGGTKNASGILAKKHDLKMLNSKITELDQAFQIARKDQKKMENRMRILEGDMQRLTEDKQDALDNETIIEKNLYKATENLKYANSHFETAHLEQSELLNQGNNIDEEISQCDKKLDEISTEIKQIQTKIAKISVEIDSISAEIEKFNRKIVDLKLKLTSFNANFESNNNTLTRLKDFKNDTIKRTERILLELEQKNEQTLFSEQKVEEYEQTLFTMYDNIKNCENELKINENSYQEIDAELKKNDGIIQQIQNNREKTMQNIRLLELEQSQRHIKRDNVANRIEESYHQTFSELRANFEQKDKTQQTPINDIKDELILLRKKLANIGGDVNLGAIKEYEQLEVRFDFLNNQYDDLTGALNDLENVIKKINKITQERFLETFDLINEKLEQVFPRLFGGGSARLALTEPNKPLETGVEFMIHPHGKKLTRLSLLSGGEKALAAIAFIFSIFLIKPASFCLMDEIDAPLDDANVFRFNEALKIIGEKSQIIMITHNKRSMQFADTLFGVTMERKGISKIVSVNLE